jgi:hypothetical protein
MAARLTLAPDETRASGDTVGSVALAPDEEPVGEPWSAEGAAIVERRSRPPTSTESANARPGPESPIATFSVARTLVARGCASLPWPSEVKTPKH